ncbi:Tubulin tyrosine ligase [Spironucleus salmonicida]|nr:Tubulin tyrosine ligase [Spironucleus salmonicida]
MIPLKGLNFIYPKEVLFLTKKFERKIKISTQQILQLKALENNLYIQFKTEAKETSSFFTQFFNKVVPNIAIFNGAFPTFREEFAKRGFIINPDLESECFNVKFVVKIADAKWDNLYPFQYINHIQGMIYLSIKGMIIETLKTEVDIEATDYFPLAYRVLTDAGGKGRIQPGNNDDTLNFFDDYINLEACKKVKRFIEIICDQQIVKQQKEWNEYVQEKEKTIIQEYNEENIENKLDIIKYDFFNIAENSEQQKQFWISQKQILEAMHILRYYLQNRIIDNFPVQCDIIDNITEGEIIQLIPNYPLQYPITYTKHEYIVTSGKGLKYLDKLSLSSLQLIFFECEFLLQQFKRNSKQSMLNDFNNIWICKPSGKSRGRGIFASDNLRQLLTLDCDQLEALPDEDLIDKDDKYIIQKYVERPLLIHGYKFDIRQWVLVSSVNPLVIWQWTRPYLRFCSAKYSNTDLNNPFIHLSNNSVQRHAESFGASIDGNMWHFSQMCEYLAGIYDFTSHPELLTSKYDSAKKFDSLGDRIMYDMARIVLATIHAARFRFGEQNGFEMFGYDFILDADLQVWCLEVNTSPTMEHSTDLVTALIKDMTMGYVSIICDGYCGLLVQTNDFQMFPKILNGQEQFPQGLNSWVLIWKDDIKQQEEFLLPGLEVKGEQIKLPKIVPCKQ